MDIVYSDFFISHKVYFIQGEKILTICYCVQINEVKL